VVLLHFANTCRNLYQIQSANYRQGIRQIPRTTKKKRDAWVFPQVILANELNLISEMTSTADEHPTPSHQHQPVHLEQVWKPPKCRKLSVIYTTFIPSLHSLRTTNRFLSMAMIWCWSSWLLWDRYPDSNHSNSVFKFSSQQSWFESNIKQDIVRFVHQSIIKFREFNYQQQ